MAFSLNTTQSTASEISVKKQFKQYIAQFSADIDMFAQLKNTEKCQTLAHLQTWGDVLALGTPLTSKKQLALYVELQPELSESFDLWVAQQIAFQYLKAPEQQYFVLGWLSNQIPRQQAHLEISLKKLLKKIT